MITLRATMLAAAIAGFAGTAFAETVPTQPTEGWYVGVGAGWNSDGQRPLLINGNQARAKFKDSFGVFGSGGYKWDMGLRTELEVSYREGKLKDFNANTLPWTGAQHDTSAMANLLWDFNTGTVVVPYLGAGVGISWLNWSNAKGPGPTIYSGTSHKFAWQGIAGVAFPITSQASITLDYRYKGSNNNSFPGNVAGTQITNYDARSNTVMLGFRYMFGAPAKKTAAAPPPPPPPAPPPPPPAPPPQPPVEHKFLVFFDFDRANLRTDATRIVAEAADYAKKNGKARITATGHTDTSGTAAYNLALSERRAKAVEKELVRLGIPANEIVVRWKGESEPLVQTGDGVKEPQNRRVEIMIE